MRLIVKFNIVFLAIFLVGLAIAAYVSLDLLRQNARDEVFVTARNFRAKAACALPGRRAGLNDHCRPGL